jgi:hypothetical protein
MVVDTLIQFAALVCMRHCFVSGSCMLRWQAVAMLMGVASTYAPPRVVRDNNACTASQAAGFDVLPRASWSVEAAVSIPR